MESETLPTETERQNRIKGSPLLNSHTFPQLHHHFLASSPQSHHPPLLAAALLCSITFVVLLLRHLVVVVTAGVVGEEGDRRMMSDWDPVVIAVVLFVLLSPGLLMQLPGKHHLVEFGNMHTSAMAILLHAIIYFALIVIVIGVHITTD
jgi:hypothetical protein